jgi:TP901 family phage tail tape measure protein
MSDNVTSLQIKVVSDQVSAAEKRLTALELAAAKAEKQNDKLGKSAISMGDTFKKAGALANAALATVGIGALGLAASVGTATQAWLSYDKAIKSVNSIAGLTQAKFKALRKDTLLLASALGVDATEAAKGLFDTFQADIPEADALAFLGSATKLAIGGGTTTSVAVNSITNVMKAYNLEASRATEISDKLFTTVLYGKAEFEGLGSALAGATVPGAALGVKFEEILAMITAITAQGTSTSESITQIERAMQALLNPSDEMLAVFKQIGVEGGRQAIANYGLVGTLEKVRQAYV